MPHVTLLRNSAGGKVPECKPVRWPISDFVLVASRREADGMHYDVIRRWPLINLERQLKNAAPTRQRREVSVMIRPALGA